ncbi:MAG TPA: S8 family serine peptidase [Candidatus Limnocylindrales bacterium]
MNRRFGAAVAVAALIVAGSMPATVAAAKPSGRTFTHLDVSRIDPQITPAILSNKPVTVMVELADTPATSRRVTKAQQVAAARQMKTGQDALKTRITKAGGRVVGQYQYAYNGIKVRISGKGVAALAALPGVTAIHGMRAITLDNVRSVPFTTAPAAWADLGITGAGQTIAVIDSGIDYTHANFGGPGTKAAFDANNPKIVEPASFPTAKVIAGWDFAGNDYDATGDEGSVTPAPDPDPLDCDGHGSHVSGTAAGDGVLANGHTYTGPYNGSTYSNSFAIGPGVAPQAKLVALKVFGCKGATDLDVDALNWVGQYNATHADAIDVVNMSLGAPLGRDSDPSAVATNALVSSGVVVVASAGNEGPNAYITGAPGAATRAISVAAEDALPSFPGAVVDFATAADITNANNQSAFPRLPVSGTLKVIKDSTGALSLGCSAADYGTLPPNAIVAIQRGVCAFVDKGAAAFAAGAVGIIDINRDDIADPNELPTFIGYNPELFDIPMIGVGRGVKAAIIAADGQAVTLKAGPTLPNPTYKQLTDFSSGGPRNGDSSLKPDVAAPGNSIVSTLVGSGNQGTTLSGTSMASPHVAGIAALVHAAHPTWSPLAVKAAIVGTASSSSANIVGYDVRTAGAGAVQARKAVATVAYATTPDGTASLSYGYDQLTRAYRETKTITIHNTSNRAIRYTVRGQGIVGVSPSSVRVPAHGTATVRATARLSSDRVAALPTNSVLLGGLEWGGVSAFSGTIVATPTSSGPGIYPIRVPFLGTPRGLSDITASPHSNLAKSGSVRTGSIAVRNRGIHAGFADVYAWGLSDRRDVRSAIATMDIRAVGLQVLPAEALTGAPDPNDASLIFAINTWGRWSSASSNEFDIAIYGRNKVDPDFVIVGADFGALTAGEFDGTTASFIFDRDDNLVDAWIADGPANSSTILLPALASDIGRTPTDSAFTYAVAGFSVEDDSLVDSVAGQAQFDVFHPTIETGQFVEVAPGDRASIPVSVANGGTKSKGWMVVTLDDRNGSSQADTVALRRR